MYSRTADRTKTVASTLYAVAAAGICILAFWCMTNVNFYVGIAVLALLVVLTYAAHLILSLFGDMAMENATSKKAYEELLAEVQKKRAEEAAKPAALKIQAERAVRTSPAFDAPKTYPTVTAVPAEDRYVICPCCGLRQFNDRTRCFDCGAFFQK